MARLSKTGPGSEDNNGLVAVLADASMAFVEEEGQARELMVLLHRPPYAVFYSTCVYEMIGARGRLNES